MAELQKIIKTVSGKERKFVSLGFSPSTEKALNKYCEKWGFDTSRNYGGDVTPLKFHITILCSENESDIQNRYELMDIPFQVFPEKLDLFGEEKSIPVCRLIKTRELLVLRSQFEDLGLKNTWDEYKPHITLSYNYSGYPKIERVPLPVFPLIINKIKVEGFRG